MMVSGQSVAEKAKYHERCLIRLQAELEPLASDSGPACRRIRGACVPWRASPNDCSDPSRQLCAGAKWTTPQVICVRPDTDVELSAGVRPGGRQEKRNRKTREKQTPSKRQNAHEDRQQKPSKKNER